MGKNSKGIIINESENDSVFVTAEAGENWHEFVLWCIAHDFGGLENLSLIPGNVGTAPIQNIGAYGVELKDTFISCETLDIETLKTKSFNNSECKFDYRNSIFKQDLKGQQIITSVTFKLSKLNHVLHTNYGAVALQLETMHVTNPTIRDVSNAVIAIRESKLPNPKDIGNSGSFFKNPVISMKKFEDFVKESTENKGKGIDGDTDLIPTPSPKQTINKGNLNPMDNLGIRGRQITTDKIDGIVQSVKDGIVYVEDRLTVVVVSVTEKLY